MKERQLLVLLWNRGAIEGGLIHGHNLAIEQRDVGHRCDRTRPQLTLCLQCIKPACNVWFHTA